MPAASRTSNRSPFPAKQIRRTRNADSGLAGKQKDKEAFAASLPLV
jgi:hypothetical protein